MGRTFKKPGESFNRKTKPSKKNPKKNSRGFYDSLENKDRQAVCDQEFEDAEAFERFPRKHGKH